MSKIITLLTTGAVIVVINKHHRFSNHQIKIQMYKTGKPKTSKINTRNYFLPDWVFTTTLNKIRVSYI